MVNTFNISNRRYLGNKYKLLDWIKSIVNENCTDVQSFFDVFSGTTKLLTFIAKKLNIAAYCRISVDDEKNDKSHQPHHGGSPSRAFSRFL